MGIPKFYSWLLQTYPSIKIPCEDNHSNRIRCDNLYLDINQIIHKYAQSNDENTIIKLVFDHIVRILSIVCPRQLLYLAIDGVTPRARMTHQRTDRFLKSKNICDGIKEKFLTNDLHQVVTTETFDECNIKPGTKFMSKLSKYLQHNICDRMNTKQNWGRLKIILSDANAPGEGEHKIIHFIRKQRNQSGYDPNTYHVIYGSDSDLVLLGLLTHERHYTIICEECGICKNIGHDAKDCNSTKFNQNNKSSLTTANDMKTKYVFIDLSKLSERLKKELQKNNSFSFPREPERSIDDWVFICLLFGNDFLPKSPSLDFSGNNITMKSLVDIYRENVEETKGYLTKNGIINMNRLLIYFKKISGIDQRGKILRHQQYYGGKFNVDKTQLGTFSVKVVEDYVQGLCWVFQYYCRGPPSWNWYYPYYYAPLVCDFSNLTNVSLNFDQNTKPFSPFEQMIATFSPQNAKYLPPEWQPLMLNEKSPIIDFYPKNFYVDPNGEQKSSQYVALLPFVDEERLLEALQPVYSKLTPEEKKRNTLDDDRLFIHLQNSYYKKFKELYDNDENMNIDEDEKELLFNYTNISNNEVICFQYRDPPIRIESNESTTSSESNSAFVGQAQQNKRRSVVLGGKP